MEFKLDAGNSRDYKEKHGIDFTIPLTRCPAPPIFTLRRFSECFPMFSENTQPGPATGIFCMGATFKRQ